MHRYSFTHNNVTYNDSNIYGGVDYQFDLFPDGDYYAGYCNSSQIIFKTDVSTISVGDTITMSYHGVTNSTVYSLGVFIVDKVVKSTSSNKQLFTVTAYDKISLLDVSADSFLQSETFPVTLTNLAKHVLNQASISYPAGFDIGSVSISSFTAKNATLRDILKWCMERHGSNGFINPLTGKFDVYTVPLVNKNVSEYKRYTDEDSTTPTFSGLIFNRADSLAYSYGTEPYYKTSHNPLIIDSPTQQEMNLTLGRINNALNKKVASLQIYELQGLMLGDNIQNPTVQSTNTFPVHSIHVTNSGTIIRSYGKAVRDENDSELNTQIQIDNKPSNSDVVTIIGDTVNAPYINALDINAKKIIASHSITFDHTQYSSADLTVIDSIINSGYATQEQIDRYDFNHDGAITLSDRVICRNMINDQQDYTITITTTIDPSVPAKPIVISNNNSQTSISSLDICTKNVNASNVVKAGEYASGGSCANLQSGGLQFFNSSSQMTCNYENDGVAWSYVKNKPTWANDTTGVDWQYIKNKPNTFIQVNINGYQWRNVQNYLTAGHLYSFMFSMATVAGDTISEVGQCIIPINTSLSPNVELCNCIYENKQHAHITFDLANSSFWYANIYDDSGNLFTIKDIWYCDMGTVTM